MIVARSGFIRRIVLWWHVCGAVTTAYAAVGGVGGNVTGGVDEFLTSLTRMIGTVLSSDARFSPPDDGTQPQVVSARPNRPAPGDFPAGHFDTGRPPYPRPYPPPPPYQGNGPRPDYFRPGPVPYPQQPNSVLQALGSISRHDDLRCVPRLLCEVSSGARPTSSGYYQQQQQSTIPFLSKDALITLLTVLNFVDDSPLLMFGRAALLGYNARGDPRSCTTAYPTCPRDPDQLIDYLNNHNGGFFRFFNQQLPQYAPGYPVHQQRPPFPQQPPFPQRPPFPPQQPPFPPQQPAFPPQQPAFPPQQPAFPPQQPAFPPQHQQYAPQYPLRPRQHFKNGTDREGRDDDGSPRILSGSYYHVPSVDDLALDVPRPPMTFPSGDDHGDGAANAVAPFAFPSSDRRRRGKSDRVKMVFPDRTGTGGLRADLDRYGNYKGVYYADGAVRFADDDGRPTKAAPPTSHFDVAGDDRLPYGRRPKFQFPKAA